MSFFDDLVLFGDDVMNFDEDGEGDDVFDYEEGEGDLRGTLHGIEIPQQLSQISKDISTSFTGSSLQVQRLWHALVDGSDKRPPLPKNVATKILDKAQYWCCVTKQCPTLAQSRGLTDCALFRLGPIPGRIRRLEFMTQWISKEFNIYEYSFPELEVEYVYNAQHFGEDPDCLRYVCAEIVVKEGEGKPAVCQDCVFSTLCQSAVKPQWQMAMKIYTSEDDLLKAAKVGDTIELRLHGTHQNWVLRIRDPRMRVYYEPIIDS